MFRSKLSAIMLALAAAGCCSQPVWAAQQATQDTPPAVSTTADVKANSKKPTKADIKAIEVKSCSGSLSKFLTPGILLSSQKPFRPVL